MTKWIRMVFGISAYPALYWKGIRASAKIRVLPSGSWSKTMNLASFLHFLPWHIERYKCSRLRFIDAYGQFITRSLELCIQHDGHNAARCAGSSVTAEACCWFFYVFISTGSDFNEMESSESAAQVLDSCPFLNVLFCAAYAYPHGTCPTTFYCSKKWQDCASAVYAVALCPSVCLSQTCFYKQMLLVASVSEVWKTAIITWFIKGPH